MLIMHKRDGSIRPVKGRLKDTSIHYKGKEYLFSRKALKTYPTAFNKLGFSRGLYPAHFVYEDSSVPVILENNGYHFDSPELLSAFKRANIVESIAESAKKTGQPNPNVKLFIIAGLITLGLFLITIFGLIYLFLGGDFDVGKFLYG